MTPLMSAAGNPLIVWIWAAGVVHLAIVAANFALPRRLQVRENAARLSPILRQVLYIHWLYIVIVLLIFAALCIFFAPELAGASPLGRFLSGAIAAFWLLRIPLQLFYYDRETRRQNRALDALYLVALIFLAGVFSASALGAGR
ncbi:MAG: hypothetical protein ACRD5F_07960 [Candidatus Acidiferrales bacterium]